MAWIIAKEGVKKGKLKCKLCNKDVLLELKEENLRRDKKVRLEVAYQKINEVLNKILEEILDIKGGCDC